MKTKPNTVGPKDIIVFPGHALAETAADWDFQLLCGDVPIQGVLMTWKNESQYDDRMVVFGAN